MLLVPNFPPSVPICGEHQELNRVLAHAPFDKQPVVKLERRAASRLLGLPESRERSSLRAPGNVGNVCAEKD